MAFLIVHYFFTVNVTVKLPSQQCIFADKNDGVMQDRPFGDPNFMYQFEFIDD